MTDRSGALNSARCLGFGLRRGDESSDTQPLDVSYADIYDGVRGSGDSCPFALVLKRLYPDLEYINLSGTNPVYKRAGGEEQSLKLPPEMIDWIGRFDRGEKVEPVNQGWRVTLIKHKKVV